MVDETPLSIAAGGDPSQTSLARQYPEQCDQCWGPIVDWRPRQRICADCRVANRRAIENRKYRHDADYRARRLAKAHAYYRNRGAA